MRKKRKRLTRAEKETILLTSEADDVWRIYTFNPNLKRRLKKFSHRFPDECRLISEDMEIRCVTYEIKKARLVIKLMPQQNDSIRRAAGERIKKYRSQIKRT